MQAQTYIHGGNIIRVGIIALFGCFSCRQYDDGEGVVAGLKQILDGELMFPAGQAYFLRC